MGYRDKLPEFPVLPEPITKPEEYSEFTKNLIGRLKKIFNDAFTQINWHTGGLINKTGENWKDVTFSSIWTNLASEHQTVQYRKFGDIVFIRGAPNSGANLWSTYPVIFVLPAEYRPLKRNMYATVGSNDAFVRVDVLSTGEVQWIAGGAGNGWISLAGIWFSVL